MFVSEDMIKRANKKQEEKEAGQARYRVEYKPENWFYHYEVQEFMYWMEEAELREGYQPQAKRRGWRCIKKFRSYDEAVSTRNRLEDVNGYLAPVPNWF